MVACHVFRNILTRIDKMSWKVSMRPGLSRLHPKPPKAWVGYKDKRRTAQGSDLGLMRNRTEGTLSCMGHFGRGEFHVQSVHFGIPKSVWKMSPLQLINAARPVLEVRSPISRCWPKLLRFLTPNHRQLSWCDDLFSRPANVREAPTSRRLPMSWNIHSRRLIAIKRTKRHDMAWQSVNPGKSVQMQRRPGKSVQTTAGTACRSQLRWFGLETSMPGMPHPQYPLVRGKHNVPARTVCWC